MIILYIVLFVGQLNITKAPCRDFQCSQKKHSVSVFSTGGSKSSSSLSVVSQLLFFSPLLSHSRNTEDPQATKHPAAFSPKLSCLFFVYSFFFFFLIKKVLAMFFRHDLKLGALSLTFCRERTQLLFLYTV